MSNIAIYPGTFDPPTNGHVDIIRRAAGIFDRLIVSVAINPRKKTLFSPRKRVFFLTKIVEDLENVEVSSFSGLLVDYAKERGARIIVRGLRAVSDFEYEFQMAHMNKNLFSDVDTVFMMTGDKYFYVSSHIVKEISGLGGDVKDLVHQAVEKELRKAFKTV